MSRTRPTEGLRRPCKKYIKFNGGRDPEDEKPLDGKFSYHVKDEGDFDAELEEPFILLDGFEFDSQLISVTGYSKAHKVYAWSNEVRSINDEIVVRLFDKGKTVVAKGPYTDIKQEVNELGLKFTRCIYLVKAGSNEIQHLALSGAAFSEWAQQIESDPESCRKRYVRFTGSKADKQGTVKFWRPSFEFGDEISEEHGKLADEADERLQEYLNSYFKKDPKQTPVYDREETNTDSWAFIPVESYDSEDERELGQLNIDELNKIREDLEDKGEEDSTFYQFVCRACKEKKDEKKEKKEKEPEKKKADLKNLFNRNKNKKEEKEEPSWKQVKMPDGSDKEFLGELTHEEITELKEVMDDNEDAQEAYPDLYEGVCIAAKLPF